MELFDKIRAFFSSEHTAKESTSDKVETMTDNVVKAENDVAEGVAEKKKDGCCGGNCGS